MLLYIMTFFAMFFSFINSVFGYVSEIIHLYYIITWVLILIGLVVFWKNMSRFFEIFLLVFVELDLLAYPVLVSSPEAVLSTNIMFIGSSSSMGVGGNGEDPPEKDDNPFSKKKIDDIQPPTSKNEENTLSVEEESTSPDWTLIENNRENPVPDRVDFLNTNFDNIQNLFEELFNEPGFFNVIQTHPTAGLWLFIIIGTGNYTGLILLQLYVPRFFRSLRNAIFGEPPREPTGEITEEIIEEPTGEITEEIIEEPTGEITEEIIEESTGETTEEIIREPIGDSPTGDARTFLFDFVSSGVQNSLFFLLLVIFAYCRGQYRFYRGLNAERPLFIPLLRGALRLELANFRSILMMAQNNPRAIPVNHGGDIPNREYAPQNDVAALQNRRTQLITIMDARIREFWNEIDIRIQLDPRRRPERWVTDFIAALHSVQTDHLRPREHYLEYRITETQEPRIPTLIQRQGPVIDVYNRPNELRRPIIPHSPWERGFPQPQITLPRITLPPRTQIPSRAQALRARWRSLIAIIKKKF